MTYINTNQVNFGVTVLACLGGAHIDNLPNLVSPSPAIHESGKREGSWGPYLAGTRLDKDVATLAKCRALHGETGARSAITSSDKAATRGGRCWGAQQRQASCDDTKRECGQGSGYLKDAPAEAEEKSCSWAESSAMVADDQEARDERDRRLAAMAEMQVRKRRADGGTKKKRVAGKNLVSEKVKFLPLGASPNHNPPCPNPHAFTAFTHLRFSAVTEHEDDSKLQTSTYYTEM